MPTFDGNQKALIIAFVDEITVLGEELETLFAMSADTTEMYYYSNFGEGLGVTSKPSPNLKPFKPENTQLLKDINYWISFLQQLKNSFNTSSLIDIPLASYQNFLSGINQMLGWADMVLDAYLPKDIPVYHNVREEHIYLSGLFTGIVKNHYLEPTPKLTVYSKLCKIATVLIPQSQVFFDVSPHQEKIENLKLKLTDILNTLNSPTPTPEETQPLTPVAIDSTGTRRLMQAILDFSITVDITFKKVINLASKGNSLASFILLYLREDLKQDLNDIRQYLQYVMGGNPDTVGITSLNEIKFVWLIGSQGNYYPVPPAESTDPDNDIEISLTNGILAGLKRADENSRWRYRRINDALFEIATNNNINKAYLDDLSPRIIKIESEVETIKTKITQIDAKIDQMIVTLNSLNNETNQ